MSIEKAVICDGCARIIGAGRTVPQARQRARETGGRSIRERGRILGDACGGCDDERVLAELRGDL